MEAIETLGLVCKDAIDWIIREAHTEKGLFRDARTIRRSNSGWREALTPNDLLDPETSFDDTYYLTIGKANRARGGGSV